MDTSARCPRCGYDLGGEVANWTRECPLAGRCPECGLAFKWPRVLALSEHPWLFEYHWRRHPVGRLLRTWYEAHRPVGFWRGVRLTDPVHLWPLGIVCVLGALFLYAGLVAIAVNSSIGSFVVVWPGGTALRADLFRLIMATAWDTIVFMLLLVPGPIVALAAMPVAFEMLPRTLRQARVRRAHLARIWLYSLFAPFTVAALWTLFMMTVGFLGYPDLIEAVNPWGWARWFRHGRVPLFGANSELVPGVTVSFAIVAWLALWWWSACRSYLRLPRSGWVVLALSVAVGLAALVVQGWVWMMK